MIIRIIVFKKLAVNPDYRIRNGVEKFRPVYQDFIVHEKYNLMMDIIDFLLISDLYF